MTKFHEAILYQLYESHVSEALELLSSEDQITEKMIMRKNETYEIWFIILKHVKQFQDLKSFRSIEKWIEKNRWYKKHFSGNVGFGLIHYPLKLDDILRRGVYDHIMSYGLKPNQKKIQMMYLKLEKFLVSKNVRYTVNTHLSGWKSKKKIEIEPGLEIHGFNEVDAHKYNKNIEYYEPHVDGMIVYGTLFPKKFLPKLEDTEENYRRVSESEKLGLELIEALRIFKKGKFGAVRLLEYSPYLKDFESKPHGYEITKNQFSSSFDKGFIFNQKEVDKFKKFWEYYKKAKKQNEFGFVSMALDRFMRTYERQDKIDPVIDFWISLEFLFTNQKINPKKFRTRIAKFLEPENLKKREKLRRFLDIAYELRNDVVHAGNNADFELDGKKINFWDIIEELEDVLRRCFKKFIKLLVDRCLITKEHIVYELDRS